MLTRTGLKAEEVRAGVEHLADVENFIHATVRVSGGLPLKAKSAFRMFWMAVRYYCFFKNTSCNKRNELHELDMGSALY